MTQVTVELFGLPRLLTGKSEVRIELDNSASLRQALAALARQHATLAGRVLPTDGQGLLPPYTLSLNGQSIVLDLETPLSEGDRILILHMPAGG